MKFNYHLKFIVVCVIFLFIIMPMLLNNREEKIKKSILQPKKKETEVYVDIIEEDKRSKEKSKLNSPASTKNDNINGILPPILANYRNYVGFKKYSYFLSKAGCKFFIIGNNSNYLYEINFNSNSLIKENIKNLNTNNFSSKSRIITDEPALYKFIDIAKKRYNLVNPQVVVLFPKSLEIKIFQCLKTKNLDMSKVISLSGYYKLNNNSLILLINEIIMKQKKQMTDINILILEL